MKKLLFISILVLLPSISYADGAKVFSTSTQPSINNVAQKITTFQANTGDLFVIAVECGNLACTNLLDVYSSPAGLGATTTESCALATSTAGAIQPIIWTYVCPNIRGGMTIATSTTSVNAINRILLTEFSGMVITNPVDSVSASTTPVTGTKISTGIATSTKTNQLLYMITGCASSTCTITANNGFTNMETGGRTTNAFQLTSSTTPTGLATLSVANTWASILLTLNVAPTVAVRSFWGGFTLWGGASFW